MGLGFRSEQLDAPVNSFSGGWRMRLQLARALMCPADLMLLDEPTNHLDLDALVWLEAWLQRYDGHADRHQPRPRVPRRDHQVTLHLDETKLTRYSGNYTAFEEMRAERMAQAAGQLRASSRSASRTCRSSSTASRPRPARPSRRRAASRRWRAWRSSAPVLTASDFQFEFREPLSLPNPMLAFGDVACGYRADDGNETRIVAGIDRSVLAGQRIGILGANGQGKSTLVKTIVARAAARSPATIDRGQGPGRSATSRSRSSTCCRPTTAR